MKFRNDTSRLNGTSASRGGFTLVELLVAMVLLAVLAPVLYQGLQVATLAGEVSQRKSFAARIAEEKLNEAVIMGQTQSAQRGTETAGPYQFQWSIKDEPWNQIANNLTGGSTPSSVNPNVVNSSTIHQVTVEVTYTAQNRTFSVHLSTLANESLQQ